MFVAHGEQDKIAIGPAISAIAQHIINMTAGDLAYNVHFRGPGYEDRR